MGLSVTGVRHVLQQTGSAGTFQAGRRARLARHHCTCQAGQAVASLQPNNSSSSSDGHVDLKPRVITLLTSMLQQTLRHKQSACGSLCAAGGL